MITQSHVIYVTVSVPCIQQKSVFLAKLLIMDIISCLAELPQSYKL